MVKKLLGFFSPVGTYEYMRFRYIESIVSALIYITFYFSIVYNAPLIVLIFIEVLLFYVRTVSVIKRLRGVGRPASDFFIIFIPFAELIIWRELWNQTSGRKEGELTEEQYKEITRKRIMREHQMPDYESEYRRFKKRPDDY